MIAAGFAGDLATLQAATESPDPALRVAGLGGLARLGALTPARCASAFADEEASVRRRALELGATLRGRGVATLLRGAIACLADDDPLVVDAACWLLGEHEAAVAVADLCEVASTHDDPRCREAAVAALGAIGADEARTTIIARLDDRPQIRRRVVVALANFEGPDVDAALERCRVDYDWQVRQAVELLDR